MLARRLRPVCAQGARRALSGGAVNAAAEIGAAAASSPPPAPPLTALDGFLAPIHAVLEGAHTVSGLPWWITIAAGTVVLKAGVFPLTVYQLRNTRRLLDAQPDTAKLWSGLRAALARISATSSASRSSNALEGQLPPQQARQPASLVRELTRSPDHMAKGWLFWRGMRAIWRKHECHPAKSFAVAFVQIPLFVSFFWGCRTMVRSGETSFATEGALWFHDLTAHDPTMFLPLTCIGLTYCSVELGFGALAKKSGDGSDGRPKSITFRIKDTIQVVLIGAAPAIVYFPAGIFCYWLPSSILGITQTFALQQPEVRAALSGSGSIAAATTTDATSAPPLPRLEVANEPPQVAIAGDADAAAAQERQRLSETRR